MTSREKFEAWYLENLGFMEDDHETLFERSPDGDGEKYYRLGVRMAHGAWQASESASQQKLTDMAVQLANAESKCRELSSKAMELVCEASLVYSKYNDTQMPDRDLVDMQTLQEMHDLCKGAAL